MVYLDPSLITTDTALWKLEVNKVGSLTSDAFGSLTVDSNDVFH